MFSILSPISGRLRHHIDGQVSSHLDSLPATWVLVTIGMGCCPIGSLSHTVDTFSFSIRLRVGSSSFQKHTSGVGGRFLREDRPDLDFLIFLFIASMGGARMSFSFYSVIVSLRAGFSLYHIDVHEQ